jgi:hypothetical protein
MMLNAVSSTMSISAFGTVGVYSPAGRRHP